MVYGDFDDYVWFWAAKNKAKQSQFTNVQCCAYCENEFEKTKPISKGAKWR